MNQEDQFFLAPQYQAIFSRLGIAFATVFTHPNIRVWRALSDRENCTLDGIDSEGKPIRFHIKRYPAGAGRVSPAQAEVAGIQLLLDAGIATAPLAAWGRLPDGRSFVILEDLAGFGPADKLLPAGLDFQKILEPTALLAARLHDAGLHHRDLYLNHFFVKLEGDSPQLRLIDAARVRCLPRFPFTNRWIVKDLSQFWYSTLKQKISDEQRLAWLQAYARGKPAAVESLRRAIERKIPWMARHDAKLNQTQPTRHLGLPS